MWQPFIEGLAQLDFSCIPTYFLHVEVVSCAVVMCPDLHYHPPPLILMKLVKERDSLALTTKKLRDLAKVILSHVNQPMYLDAGY
ncbi:hypothetical protein LIER_24178 [Lithospermum erythrorhizon]|uniref:Uncharacterized protein n=1 Tax=Lithospermum erythrorhizon TaxID=34254 RepID=A0AAV3R1N8_LITER